MQQGRLVYVEPNDIIKDHIEISNKNHGNFTWNPEDLNLYVDLQVVCPNRSDCGEESDITENGGYSNAYISLMEGVKIGKNNTLTTDYINVSYNEIKNNNVSSKEALGITSIDITFDPHFYPKVTINFTDVRAYSLFMPAEEEYKEGLKNEANEAGKYDKKGRAYTNFFAAVFHFPYPRFLLTVKGFYGTKVTFVLAVDTFKSSFNSNTGNFDVSINFIGYMYGIYTDIPMNCLFCAPYVGELDYNDSDILIKSKYWTKKIEDGTFITEDGNPLPTFLEFAKNYSMALANLNNNESLGDDFVIYANTLDLINRIDEINTGLDDLLNEFGYNEEGKQVYEAKIEGNNTAKYIYYFFRKTDEQSEIKVTWNVDKTKVLQDKISHVNSDYKDLLKSDIATPYLCKPAVDDKENPICEGIVIGKVSDVIKINNEGTVEFITNKINHFKIGNETYSYSPNEYDKEAIKKFFSNKTSDDINNYLFSVLNIPEEKSKNAIIKKELEQEKKKYHENAVTDAEGFISRELQFKPSIENVFRMTFAHLDCFFNSYLVNTVYDIKSNKDKRTIKNLNLKKEETDINFLDKNGNAFVPPFFGYFEDINSTKTLAYPGDSLNEKINNIKEVELVRGYINAAKSFVKSYEEMVEEVNALSVANETVTSGEISPGFNGSFEPTTFFDVYYGNQNPYTFIKSTEKGSLLNDILYLFYLRLITFEKLTKVETKTDIEKFVEIEYKNITSAFPNLDKTLFNIIDHEGVLLNRIIEYSQNKIVKIDNKGDYQDLNDTKGKLIVYKMNTGANVEDSARDNLFKVDYSGVTFNAVRGIQIKDISLFEGFKNIQKKLGEKNLETSTNVLFECPNRLKMSEGAAAYPNRYIIPEDDISNSNICTLQVTNEETPKRGFGLPVVLYQNAKGKVRNLLYDMTSDILITNSEVEKAFYFLSSLVGRYINKVYNKDLIKYYGLFVNKITLIPKIFVLYYGCILYLLRRKVVNDTNIVHNLFKYDKNNTFKVRRVNYHSPNATEYKDLISFYSMKEVNDNNDCKNLILDLVATVTSTQKGKDESYGDFFNKAFSEHIKAFNALTEVQKKDTAKILKTEEPYLTEIEKYFLNWRNNDFKHIIKAAENENSQAKEITIKFQSTGEYLNVTQNGNNTYVSFTHDTWYSMNNIHVYPFSGKTSKDIATLLSETVCMISTNYHKPNSRVTKNAEPLKTIFNKLKNNSNTNNEVSTNTSNNSNVLESNKNLEFSLYYTFKNIYDKWVCSYGDMKRFELGKVNEDKETRKTRYKNNGTTTSKREINNFIFVDSLYRDIGQTFMCNPSTIIESVTQILEGQNNISVYQFLHELCQKNKLMMRAVPVYNNFYTEEGLKEIFTPKDVFNINQSQENGFAATYLIMYTHQHSMHLDNEKSDYINDGMDIGRTIITSDTLKLFSNEDEGYVAPTFAVTYGAQNQSYFKGININMDNPITTDYSIANQLQIAQTAVRAGDLSLPMGIGQNIYSIYSNRSYNCTVEMMGCANIMPMMYFQLNNIPMFKGVYMIINVKHSIRNGNMTTTFTGVRQTSIIYPFINSNLILTSMLERLNSTVNLSNFRKYINTNQKDYTNESNKSPLVFNDSNVNFKYMNLLEGTLWIPKSSNYPLYNFANGRKITKIILHGTSGSKSTEGSAEIYRRSWNCSWNKDFDYKASADFAVDDIHIVQFNPDLEHYASFSTSNSTYDKEGISIEICTTYNKTQSNVQISEAHPNMPQWSFSEKVLNNTKNLIFALFEKFGELEIITHYDVTGKACPAVKGWNKGQLYDVNNKPIIGKYSDTSLYTKFLKEVKEEWKAKKDAEKKIS